MNTLTIETRLSADPMGPQKGKGLKIQSQYCLFLVQQHTFLTLGGRGSRN
jgi:hypothetical protein